MVRGSPPPPPADGLHRHLPRCCEGYRRRQDCEDQLRRLRLRSCWARSAACEEHYSRRLRNSGANRAAAGCVVALRSAVPGRVIARRLAARASAAAGTAAHSAAREPRRGNS